jgi:peroxiredoxin Q/BCP
MIGVRFFTLLCLAAAALLPHAAAATAPLQVGEPAPAFTLPDADGKAHQVGEWRGHWLVLYFYPRDDTPGCTAEAQNFRDSLPAFAAVNANIVGISLDDGASHRAFADKQHLPFTLLSDPGGTVALRYGSLTNLGIMHFAKRQTYLIDPEGLVAKVYLKVDPAEHVQQLLADIRSLANP